MRSVHRLGLFSFVIAAGSLLFAAHASAQQQRNCSVLDNKPCTPHSCGVYDGPNCVPDVQYGLGEDLRLTLGTAAAKDAKAPDGDLNTLRDLFAALRACWRPPAAEHAHRGMQMSLRFAFNRDGKLMGPPQLTYATPDVPREIRDLYRKALAQSLQDCTPLSFSKGLGGAVAGRPISIRVIDDRKDGGKEV